MITHTGTTIAFTFTHTPTHALFIMCVCVRAVRVATVAPRLYRHISQVHKRIYGNIRFFAFFFYLFGLSNVERMRVRTEYLFLFIIFVIHKTRNLSKSASRFLLATMISRIYLQPNCYWNISVIRANALYTSLFYSLLAISHTRSYRIGGTYTARNNQCHSLLLLLFHIYLIYTMTLWCRHVLKICILYSTVVITTVEWKICINELFIYA